MSETAMTEAELSKGSGAAPQFIRRLVDLGNVPSRDGERPFVLGDIHRVRLAPSAMLSARLVSIPIVEHVPSLGSSGRPHAVRLQVDERE